MSGKRTQVHSVDSSRILSAICFSNNYGRKSYAVLYHYNKILYLPLQSISQDWTKKYALFCTNILTREITSVIDKELIYIMCLLECCVDASVMPIYGKLCILDIKYLCCRPSISGIRKGLFMYQFIALCRTNFL